MMFSSLYRHIGMRIERYGVITRQMERYYARMVSRQPVRVHLPHTQVQREAEQHYEKMLNNIKKTPVQRSKYYP